MKENLSESNLRDPVETLCGVFKDMQVPDKPGDRVRWMGALLWSFYEIFIKTQHQEPCQDITFSPWRTWMYMMDLEMGSGEWRALWNYSEIFIKIRCQMIGIILQKVLRKFYQDLTSGTLSRLHLSSKPLSGVLEDLEVVLDDRYHPSEASAKVSSRFNIRNPVKTPPVLQVSSWSFGGHWGSLWTWRWCQMIGIILQKLLWKLHHYPSS